MTSALIIGRAMGVWYEVESAVSTYDFDMVIAVNVAGCDYSGTLEHWVSYHPELFPNWLERRRTKGFEEPGQLWTSSRGRRGTSFEETHSVKLIDCEGGSSGLIAVRVALKVGADKIVLAGIPMENSAGQYDTGKAWDEAQHHKLIWIKHQDELRPFVRSMSGWTRETFGGPTCDWMKS